MIEIGIKLVTIQQNFGTVIPALQYYPKIMHFQAGINRLSFR